MPFDRLSLRCVRRPPLLALIFAAWLTVGCRSTGPFVWVDDLTAASYTHKVEGTYVIGVGDLLAIRVYNQEAISSRVRVRADGKIAIPLVGEVEARGRTTKDLADHLTTRLKDYVNAPSLAVTLEERTPIQVTVLGEVTRQGIFNIEPQSTVLQALGAAGGPTEFAALRVFVLRTPAPGKPVARIRFSYDALTRGEGRAPLFTLQTDDVVIVE